MKIGFCRHCAQRLRRTGLLDEAMRRNELAEKRANREIIGRLCDEGLSYREVSERTGYSVRQVKRVANEIAGGLVTSGGRMALLPMR